MIGRWRRVVPGLVFSGALCWGYYHHSGTAPQQHGHAFVRYSEYTGAGKANLILNSNGSTFSATGAAYTGDIGTYHCRDVARLFRRQQCAFTTIATPQNSRHQTFSPQVRGWLLSRLSRFDDDIRAWTASLVLGEYSRLPAETIAAFRSTGTYHILVISGMHLTFLAFGLHALIMGPLRILYAARICSPTLWIKVWQVVPLATILLVYSYAVLTGMSPPVQRALLCFVVHKFCEIFASGATIGHNLSVTLFLQMLLYPVGIFSESSLLSWTAYLLVVTHRHAGNYSYRQILCGVISMQTKMCIVVAFVCQQLCWIGIFINPIANPISNSLMIASILLFVPGLNNTFLADIGVWFIRLFIRSIHLAAELAILIETAIFGAEFARIEHPYAVRVLLALIFSVIVLNSVKSMTIRSTQR